MIKGILSETRAGTKLIITLASVVLCFVVFNIIALVCGIVFFDVNLLSNPQALMNVTEENVAFMKFFQAIQSLGMFVFSALLAVFLYAKSIRNELNLKPTKIVAIIIALILTFTITPFLGLSMHLNSFLELPDFMSGIQEWMQSKEDSIAEMTKVLLNVEGLGGLMANLLVIAVIPAIGEEFIFRGIIQKQFGKIFKNHHIAILVAAFIFSAIHLQFFGFLPRFILGIILGYLYVWSKSLWLPILFHFFNNGKAVILAYKTDIDKAMANEFSLDSEFITLFVLFSAITVLLMIVLYKLHKRKL